MFNTLNCGKTLSRCTSWVLNVCRDFSSRSVDSILSKGTWNPPPICPGRKMKEPSAECKPNYGSGDCSRASALKGGKVPDYMCCTDPRLRQDCENTKKFKKKDKKPPFKSMWETLPNYEIDCKAPPRLDLELYKPSDKLKRIYRRTWEQCDVYRLRKRKMCCFDEEPCLPPLYKRKSGQKSILACEQSEPELLKINLTTLRECMGQLEKPKDGKCRKIRMPHCQPVAKSLRCLKTKSPGLCKRECAPYPSFSECVRDALRKGRPIECDCLNIPMQCEAFKLEPYKKKFNIPPPVPAWPPERPK